LKTKAVLPLCDKGNHCVPVLKIAKDKALSEFEVQALALSSLKEALGDGYIVRGEYSYQGCRFDLAIFDIKTRELICTIEIKKYTKNRGEKRQAARQARNYEVTTGRPCILLHEGNLQSMVAAVRARMTTAAGLRSFRG
jgi:hypothetical protein